MRSLLLAAAITLGALATNGCAPPLDTVPYVDTSQLEGTWFEIGHLPRTTQEGCSGTTSTYTSVSDGHFAAIHQCNLADGTELSQAATMYVIDNQTNAKLGIDLGGFIGDFWIIDLASDYHYFVVGHPSHDYLWIMSRDKHLSSGDLQTILANASAKGFDTSRVEYTDQDGTFSNDSNSAGCSATTARHVTGGAAFGLLALGAVAWLRRRRPAA